MDISISWVDDGTGKKTSSFRAKAYRKPFSSWGHWERKVPINCLFNLCCSMLRGTATRLAHTSTGRSGGHSQGFEALGGQCRSSPPWIRKDRQVGTAAQTPAASAKAASAAWSPWASHLLGIKSRLGEHSAIHQAKSSKNISFVSGPSLPVRRFRTVLPSTG